MKEKLYIIENDKVTYKTYSISYDKDDKYRYEYALAYNREDAEYIVKAVNEYEGLKEENEILKHNNKVNEERLDRQYTNYLEMVNKLEQENKKLIKQNQELIIENGNLDMQITEMAERLIELDDENYAKNLEEENEKLKEELKNADADNNCCYDCVAEQDQLDKELKQQLDKAVEMFNKIMNEIDNIEMSEDTNISDGIYDEIFDFITSVKNKSISKRG